MTYWLLDSSLNLITETPSLIGGDTPGVRYGAVDLAKQHRGPCVVVRCADREPVMAFGERPGLLLRAAQGLSGVAGAA